MTDKLTPNDRARQVLIAMHEQAVDGIWEGRLTELVQNQGSYAYYGKIIALLKGSGAAEQLQRGGMGVPSRWRVINPAATLEDDDSPSYRTGGVIRKRDRLEARIEAVEKRLGGLDIGLALGDIIRRLDMFELAALGKGQSDANGDRPQADSPASE